MLTPVIGGEIGFLSSNGSNGRGEVLAWHVDVLILVSKFRILSVTLMGFSDYQGTLRVLDRSMAKLAMRKALLYAIPILAASAAAQSIPPRRDQVE